MSILHAVAQEWKLHFPLNGSGQERFHWFVLTLQAMIVPITVSRTSNLLRSIATLFGLDIEQGRYYTFMASVKLPWEAIWETLWRAIPTPLTDGRLVLALDDSINPKSGQKVFACQRTFDHAAKANHSRWPWAQTIVCVGLLARVHGRWACLPLAFRFYLRRRTLREGCVRLGGKALVFADKFSQAVTLVARIAAVFSAAPILVVADSWFGNNGLLRPLRVSLGERAQLLSRLRVNAALYAPPVATPRAKGRPRKYGARLGNAAELAATMRENAKTYNVHLYAATREVLAAERVVMIKTLRCAVRVVWVYRRTQWVALMTTDLSLSVTQIIEYYSARWKIESGFREIKQEIGSAYTQTRTPDAVVNHLQFCMAATTMVWLYALDLRQSPSRRYHSEHTVEFSFADARRALAQQIAKKGFGIDCVESAKRHRKPLIAQVMRLVA